MSYYMRGDYYRGDYYRGDPGPFSFIEKAVKGVARAIVPGAGVAIDAYRAVTNKPKASFTPAISPGHPIAIPEIGNMLKGAMKLSPAGLAQSAIGAFLGPQGVSSSNGCPRGFHPDKKTGTRCVRNRSMNPLNHRALKRGLRRAEGFEKIARRTVNALRSGPKKFKAKGRKR